MKTGEHDSLTVVWQYSLPRTAASSLHV